MKVFLQRILQEIMKKIILGTSDAWSMVHLSHRPSDRAWIYLRLTNFCMYLCAVCAFLNVLSHFNYSWIVHIINNISTPSAFFIYLRATSRNLYLFLFYDGAVRFKITQGRMFSFLLVNSVLMWISECGKISIIHILKVS